MGLIDETGNTYGYLTVLRRGENTKDGKARWVCKCKCGNETLVLGKHLRSGNTKSCGCYQKERATESNLQRAGSLVGQRFGKLVVLEEAGFIEKPNGRKSRLYKCQCDCGSICYVQHVYLAFGDTKSCGCIKSHGETEIDILLRKHNIDFIREFEFSDLVDIKPLRFDFAIIKDYNLLCLIEFQGEQHWQKTNGFYNEKIIEHDYLKKEYCKKNNIPLYYLYYKERTKNQVTWEDLQVIPEIKEYFNELHS